MFHPDKVLIAASLRSETIEEMVLEGKRIMSLPPIDRPNILEARIDYPDFKTLNLDSITYLIKELSPVPIIITPRHIEEIPSEDKRGGFKGSEHERMLVFRNAVAAGCAYIDMEYMHKLPVELSESQTKIILSSHNFHHTPSIHSIIKLYKKMHKSEPEALIKIVTTALSFNDNYHMNSFIDANSHYRNLIAHCRGEIGKDTRVKGPLLGSLIAYARSNILSSTDSGQITVGELRKSMRKEYSP